MSGLKKWIAPAVTACLLGGVFADKLLSHTPPPDAAPYHERVRARFAEIPARIGSWVGTDVEVPPSAVAMLHPNGILCREYRDTVTGRRVTFMIVQCSDARDILGHYPPACYVRQGWSKVSASPKDWAVDGLVIHGTQYGFERMKLERGTQIAIDNFMLLPDGRTCADMDGVNASAQDTRKKYFGAAQVQILSDGTLSAGERDALVGLFVTANRHLIDVILSGVTP
jgi:hypothetical protein